LRLHQVGLVLAGLGVAGGEGPSYAPGRTSRLVDDGYGKMPDKASFDPTWRDARGARSAIFDRSKGLHLRKNSPGEHLALSPTGILPPTSEPSDPGVVTVTVAKVINMRMRLAQKMPSLLLLFVFVLASALDGFVMCRGGDGRVAVGSGVYGRCGTTEVSRERQVDQQSRGSALRAGACYDIPLADSFVSGVNKRLSGHRSRELAAPGADGLASWLVTPRGGEEPQRQPAIVALPAFQLAHLRTIVLLV